jgi:hypothetical protein
LLYKIDRTLNSLSSGEIQCQMINDPDAEIDKSKLVPIEDSSKNGPRSLQANSSVSNQTSAAGNKTVEVKPTQVTKPLPALVDFNETLSVYQNCKLSCLDRGHTYCVPYDFDYSSSVCF